jgi:hypothetical protein
METDKAIVLEGVDDQEQNRRDDAGKISERSGYVWL